MGSQSHDSLDDEKNVSEASSIQVNDEENDGEWESTTSDSESESESDSHSGRESESESGSESESESESTSSNSQSSRSKKDCVETVVEMEPPKKRKVRKRFTLPFFFNYIAWILCLGSILVSIFYLWSYGVMFGNDKTYQWLTSILASFWAGMLIVEPLKVHIH